MFFNFCLNPGEDFFFAHFYFSDHVSLLLVATFGNTFRTLTGKNIRHNEEAVSDSDETNQVPTRIGIFVIYAML